MKKYLVGIREVHVNTVEVLAESEEEAKMKCRDGEFDEIELEYSHTLDPDLWTVEESTDEPD